MRRMSGVCDVIIVLGAAVWPGGQPSPALRRRVTHAVHLLQSEKGRRLLVTGGLGKHAPAEAHVMRQLAIDAGVLPSHILIEDQATSTFESAMGCVRILRQHDWTTGLVVTDRYHLPRALLAFRGLGVQVRGSAPEDGLYSRKRWKRCYYRLREVFAFVWYACRITAWKVRCTNRLTKLP